MDYRFFMVHGDRISKSLCLCPFLDLSSNKINGIKVSSKFQGFHGRFTLQWIYQGLVDRAKESDNKLIILVWFSSL